jgi:hypothetical protein
MIWLSVFVSLAARHSERSLGAIKGGMPIGWVDSYTPT